MTKTALEDYERHLEPQVRETYRRRMEEGYDLPGSPTFKTWKSLYTAPSSRRPQLTQPTSSVINEILTYPSQPSEKNTKDRKKSAKKSIPNFLNNEASLAILRDEKLKKAREVAEKQKKLKEREKKKKFERKNRSKRKGREKKRGRIER